MGVLEEVLLGHDEVGPAIEQFTGRKLEPAPPRATAPTEVLRLPVAVAVDESRMAALRSNGVWRRNGLTNE